MLKTLQKIDQHLHRRRTLSAAFNGYIGQAVKTDVCRLPMAIDPAGWPVHETQRHVNYDDATLRAVMKTAFEQGLTFSAEVPFTSRIPARQVPKSYGSSDSVCAVIKPDRHGTHRIARFKFDLR